ncbi:hypothetical protein C2G38_2034099 [Gigaspora rosea]|uniref:Uncharacterized protein n=1 Tax=Gigaspora rosea TaxID=44941 RepID=A0A397VH50_9GLOM|nr:hypothetical protein C2G38_2034099 [Gigaspora rosea]
MVFMKDKSQIPPDEESNVKLEQFMDSGTIVIKVESLKELPKCNHLIKQFYLKHGFKKMNDSIEILKKAIKFHCKTKEETKKGKCRCIKTYTKIEVHSKGIETSTDTSHKKLISVLRYRTHFLPKKIAISYERANEIIKQIDNSHEYNEIIFKKAELKLHKPNEDKELNKYLQDLKGSSLDESYKEEIRNFINNSKEVLKNNSLKNLENLEKRVKEELHKIYEEFAQTSNKDEEKKREVVKDIGFEVVGERNKNEFDLHVGWIIVGYPKTFDVEEPEFKCSEHIKETDTIQVDLDDFPLITCVQDLQPLDDYNKYNSIALGVTFSKEDCISDACLFAYNVKSRQLEQIDDWSAFSINYREELRNL